MAVPPECNALNQEVNQLIEETSEWPIEDSGLLKSGLAVQLQRLAEKGTATLQLRPALGHSGNDTKPTSPP